MVDMRRGAEPDDRIGVLDAVAGEIAVQVHRDDQRDIGADQLAHGGDDLAVRIVQLFGHHRAMQREQHAVEGARRLDR